MAIVFHADTFEPRPSSSTPCVQLADFATMTMFLKPVASDIVHDICIELHSCDKLKTPLRRRGSATSSFRCATRT